MGSRVRVEQAILAEAQARLAELRGGAAPTPFLLPYGFRTPHEFTAFGQMMHGGLRDMQYHGVQVFLRGSALDRRNSRTGEFFDVGRRSDLDIALASPALFRRAAEIGVELRGGGTRTEELTYRQLERLGLSTLAEILSKRVDRPVTFMIYNSSGAVRQRGPSLPILGK
jgi:filamentous hemagglutinin